MNKKTQEMEFIVTILKSYGAKKISLFGSYARGENKIGSDIDVLVEFKEAITLIDLAHIIRIVKEETGYCYKKYHQSLFSSLHRKRLTISIFCMRNDDLFLN